MTQIKFTFACDNCGARYVFNWAGSPDTDDRGRVDAGRNLLRFMGWHYVTSDQSQDGRCWELCNSQVCAKCKAKKYKVCTHSCQEKWAAVAPTGTQAAPLLAAPIGDELS
jgi:hypothetical protein